VITAWKQIFVPPMPAPISNRFHQAWDADPSHSKLNWSGQCCVATLNVDEDSDRGETEEKCSDHNPPEAVTRFGPRH
jgi:hypothetical protein